MLLSVNVSVRERLYNSYHTVFPADRPINEMSPSAVQIAMGLRACQAPLLQLICTRLSNTNNHVFTYFINSLFVTYESRICFCLSEISVVYFLYLFCYTHPTDIVAEKMLASVTGFLLSYIDRHFELCTENIFNNS